MALSSCSVFPLSPASPRAWACPSTRAFSSATMRPDSSALGQPNTYEGRSHDLGFHCNPHSTPRAELTATKGDSTKYFLMSSVQKDAGSISSRLNRGTWSMNSENCWEVWHYRRGETGLRGVAYLLWRLGKQEVSNNGKRKEIVRHFLNLWKEYQICMQPHLHHQPHPPVPPTHLVEDVQHLVLDDGVHPCHLQLPLPIGQLPYHLTRPPPQPLHLARGDATESKPKARLRVLQHQLVDLAAVRLRYLEGSPIVNTRLEFTYCSVHHEMVLTSTSSLCRGATGVSERYSITHAMAVME